MPIKTRARTQSFAVSRTVFYFAGTVAALSLMAALSRAADCKYESVDERDCARLSKILGSWKPALQGIEVVGAKSAAVPQAEQPSPELDAAVARAKQRAERIGPCRYEAAENRIEIDPKAFRLSDDALAQCLSQAVAQARYESIEGKWLAQHDEHEAWVVRDGELTKVSVERKVVEPAARQLWASLASRELLNALPVSEATGRAIASDVEAPRATRDGEIMKLLGFE